ncbi:MAG: translocase FtsK protein [Microgenomates group bacterium GW2011_GWC1_46_16]|nr:MAG: translocase FtsK protein [Microgenomates group bacterium GW2011_GWF1_46_12]KKU26915.1 MAG: translocase FtsK protein [Microgenomates group bacterium GW2011_GWC1_46_16]KKU28332.1 MAG: translocase FtsK protein [Microgenomates group bacterium GW2011_GWF2_46_18]KKU45206.1 MAG: translocase FtsK protein [Microgenomates group bacterium GW2011_GWB1_46_7]KKU60544.1 MAG: translocase FtsK protein [Microgenomates group bacterium GW2011_GWD1_47_13]KKU62149.1 MAG: translocase FtsK protein [Microgenom
MSHRRGRRKKPFKLKLRKEIVYSIVSILFILLSILIMLSFTRSGPLLTQVYLVVYTAFGWTMLILPFLLLSVGLMMTTLKWAIASPSLLLGGTLLFLGTLGLTGAGELGTQANEALSALFTSVGASIIFFAIMTIGLIVLTNTPIEDFFLVIAGFFRLVGRGVSALFSRKSAVKQTSFDKNMTTKINLPESNKPAKSSESASSAPTKEAPPDLEFASSLSPAKEGTPEIWKYPPLSLLSGEKGTKADRGNVQENADIIESTLESFNIRAKVIEVNGGPAITQYAIKIAEGTKLSKVKALQTDLALALAAPTGQIRIEAPIPGRNLVGIEIPNRSPEYVTLAEIMHHPDMKKEKSRLAVGLGLGVSGTPAIADIKKMPHILVAGSTGSGKSVCINTIITTLLFRNSPQELRFIMVDPKRVELTGYNGIPHLLTPVIVDAERVISALNWATKEMDKRYKIFAEVGVRNIEEYNEASGFTAMEYIVIVIDELADIMLTAPTKVEDLIVRLAQMARATGLHLVIATQRPSVNVITGLIKANIPTRIAFNVTSMIDSRVIIDQPGAEKLLGRGDMLYVPPDRPLPTRIQGTFVTNTEIKGLIEYLKATTQKPVQYETDVTEKYLKGEETVAGGSGDERDAEFDDAVNVVIAAGKASTSYLQRKMSLGYNKAARIMDQLEKAGVVGQAEGVKPRSVLITSLAELKARESTPQP